MRDQITSPALHYTLKQTSLPMSTSPSCHYLKRRNNVVRK